MVFRLFVWIRDRVFFFPLPSSPLKYPQSFYSVFQLFQICRVFCLYRSNFVNGIDEIFVRGSKRFRFQFIFANSLFFFFHTDSLLFVRDYSLILLNVHVGTDQFIFFIFVHIRMKEEYNRNDLLSGKKKIIELKENIRKFCS